jgi:MGT family glycosyltransferase
VRVLQVIWDGGGNTAPQLAIARTLVQRGHEVRVLAHRCQRPKVEATGATFAGYREAPEADASSPETDLLRDWEAKTPPGAFARARDRLMFGPSLLFARDVLATLEEFPADVVAWDYLILGAAIAAERAEVTSVAVIHTVYPVPTPGLPPFGLGFQPARGTAGRARDALVRPVFARLFKPGLKAANHARRDLGLPPYATPFDPLTRPDLSLVLTAREFDFTAGLELPASVRYTGPIMDAAPAAAWDSPWADDDDRPLVIASFSTTFMDQQDLARRTVEALGALPVRGLVTTGPAIDGAALPRAANVEIRAFVPHAAVLPHADLMVTHAGLGTVHAALSAGVPLVCIPHGRDQDDVTARVVFHGAGVRAKRNVTPPKLAEVVSGALADPAHAAGAQRMGEVFRQEDGAARAADELESLAR